MHRSHPSDPKAPKVAPTIKDDPIEDRPEDRLTLEVRGGAMAMGFGDDGEASFEDRETAPPPLPVAEYVRAMMQQADTVESPPSQPSSSSVSSSMSSSMSSGMSSGAVSGAASGAASSGASRAPESFRSGLRGRDGLRPTPLHAGLRGREHPESAASSRPGTAFSDAAVPSSAGRASPPEDDEFARRPLSLRGTTPLRATPEPERRSDVQPQPAPDKRLGGQRSPTQPSIPSAFGAPKAPSIPKAPALPSAPSIPRAPVGPSARGVTPPSGGKAPEMPPPLRVTPPLGGKALEMPPPLRKPTAPAFPAAPPAAPPPAAPPPAAPPPAAPPLAAPPLARPPAPPPAALKKPLPPPPLPRGAGLLPSPGTAPRLPVGSSLKATPIARPLEDAAVDAELDSLSFDDLLAASHHSSAPVTAPFVAPKPAAPLPVTPPPVVAPPVVAPPKAPVPAGLRLGKQPLSSFPPVLAPLAEDATDDGDIPPILDVAWAGGGMGADIEEEEDSHRNAVLPGAAAPAPAWGAERSPSSPGSGSIPPILDVGWAFSPGSYDESNEVTSVGSLEDDLQPVDELQARVDEGDFAGALLLAERLLAMDPADARARALGELSRERLIDAYALDLGGRRRVPHVIMDSDEIRWLALDHRAGFLLSCIDGRMSVEEVLDVSGMPALDALRLLCDLRDRGVIALTSLERSWTHR